MILGMLIGAQTLHDLPYVSNGVESQKLDLYLPEGVGKHPVLVFVHGGGWQGGDKAGAGGNQRLVNRGIAVASINYRLSHEAVFPAQIQDCKAAIRWLRSNAAKYSLDASKIIVSGSSAGGHLVALLGTSGNTKTFDVGENLNQSSAVQGVVDYFGPTDLLKMDEGSLPGSLKHLEPNSPESKLMGGNLSTKKDLAGKANPITYISKSTPPFFIAHGTEDHVVNFGQSQLLYDALKKAGISVTLHPVKGADHGFNGATQDQRRELFLKMTEFVEGILKGK